MRKLASVVLAVVLVLVSLAARAAGAPVMTDTVSSQHADYYVAPNGRDEWSGALPAPNDDHTDGPFATLLRARDAVRSHRKQPPTPTMVMVRGGKYFLDEALVLGPQDGGSFDAPVTWRAYPGETPILSGGRRIHGWSRYTDDIWRAPMPSLRDRPHRLRELFVGGQRQVRARYPNLVQEDPLYDGWLFTQATDVPQAIGFEPGVFERDWAQATEGEIYYVWGFIPIRRRDDGDAVLEGGYQPPNMRFRVENLLEEIDQPGEWCAYAAEGAVYLWPPEDIADIESAEVVAPVLDCLIEVDGASWLTISGFRFTETTGGQVPYREGLDGYGAFMPPKGSLPDYCGEAIHLVDVAHCVVEDSHFDAVWGNGIFLEGRCTRNIVRRNEFSGVGHAAVCLFGTFEGHPQFNRIEDNHIHDCGAVNKAVAGIYSGVGNGNVYAYNDIHDMPNHAINLGANGYGRNYVEHNDIRGVCLENCDTGAINMWMDDDAYPTAAPIPRDAPRSGHFIRHNLIMDVFGCCVHPGGVISSGPENARHVATLTSGVYVDDTSSNCLIYGNVIVRSGSGVMLHGGRNNVVQNNVIVGCKYQYTLNNEVLTRPGNEPIYDFLSGNRFIRNIFYATDPDSFLFAAHFLNRDRADTTPDTADQVAERLEAAVGEADHNVLFGAFELSEVVEYWNGWPTAARPAYYSLDRWRALGFDAGTVLGDPLFVDPAKDDYRLMPESPALSLGFVQIDAGAIGIRTPGPFTDR